MKTTQEEVGEGFTEDELLASLCRSSFADFLKEFWDVVNPGDRLHWNWHLQVLCDAMQEIGERVIAGKRKKHDLIINISPGTTKSTIASIMFPAWLWTRMSHCRVITASYAFLLACDLSRKSRDVIESEKYHKLFPHIKLRSDQNTKGFFVNTRAGERYAIGVDGGVMGRHAHIIIVDDPLDPKQAASEADLATANRWMEETLPSRKVDKRNTPTILIMQRLHEGDPTGIRLEKNIPVKHICLPAELANNVNPPELAEYYVDGLMDPERLGWDVLSEVAQDGDFVYSGQYMQNPIPRGGAMFDVDKLNFSDFPPEEKDMVAVVRYWDKAGTAGGRGAFSAGAKVGKDRRGRFWVLDMIRGRWNSGKRERNMVSVAALDGKKIRIVVEQEPGSGGKESALGSIRGLAGYRVRAHKVGKSDGDKEDRADAFSAQVNNGNVWVVRAPWNKDFVKEMRYFPLSRHKDQVDASSGGFNVVAGKTIRVGAGRRRRSAA
jgi:predicted phage terminase large subunit-like protein